MTKGLLKIAMPKNCVECPLAYRDRICEACMITGNPITNTFDEDESELKRNDDCPLKEVPDEYESINESLIIRLLERRVAELENYIKNNQSFIQLEIYDKDSDTTHVIGTNPHDMLYVENGKVEYYNLQNGCGTPETYSFVEKPM